MKNFRDIETLSAYIDGQLNAADAARLETRLKTDPELASVMNDLRAARGILRKLPARKAPRNFTLTRPDGSSVEADVSYDASTRTATLDPDADLAQDQGRPPRQWESESTRARRLSTGVVGAACVHRTVRNTGRPGGARGEDRTRTGAKGRGASQESEGPMVPAKRGNARGGKGPWFRVLRKKRTSRRLACPSSPPSSGGAAPSRRSCSGTACACRPAPTSPGTSGPGWWR